MRTVGWISSSLVVIGVILACGWAEPVLAQDYPPQQVHRADFQPVEDEVFEILKLFYDLDESQPLDERTVERWETEWARMESLVFTTTTNERVPADLALPRAADGPYPAVLLLHGLGSSRDYWWRPDREALPRGLLRAGIAVVTLDLELHGARASRNDYQSPVYLTLGATRFVRSRDMVVQSTLDARRTLALLRRHPEIDPDRLAVVGVSMGGMIATVLGALEPSLVAAVVLSISTREQPLPIDPFQFAPRVDVPVLLQIGRTDWLSCPEDAERLHELFPAESGRLLFYDSGHTLPAEFSTDTLPWLVEQLRLEGSSSPQ